MPDWDKIRAEYAATEISAAALSDKYDIPVDSIRQRMRNEKWTDLRRKTHAKNTEKLVEKIANENANRAARFYTMTDELAKKLSIALSKADPENTDAIRKITSSLKDLRDMLGIRTDLDTEEQKARIKNLQKEENEDKNITVIFSDNEKFAE